MDATVGLQRHGAPVNSLDHRDPSLDREGQCPLTTLLADAVDAGRMSEKEAARDMGYDPAYWSRIKAGDKAAHLERLARLPEVVQREFVMRWALRLRMKVSTDDARTAAVMELLEVAARAVRTLA
jgi:C4-dicarboxylate-specific signal transduction histidine kinase